MSWTKNTDLQNLQVNASVGALTTLEIWTALGGTLLLTFPLTWGAAVAGVANLTGTPIQAVAAAGGTAGYAVLKNPSAPNEEANTTDLGTLGSGSDVELSSLTIVSGRTYNLATLSYTAATASV